MKPAKITSKVSSVQLYAMLQDLEDRLILTGDLKEAQIVGQEKHKIMLRAADELMADSSVLEADAIGLILVEDEKPNEVEYLFGGDRSIDWSGW